MRYRFSKKHRLSKKKEIDLIFKKGKYRACGILNIKYLNQSYGYTRIVISISKRVGTAPERNRLKRLIREAIRLSGDLSNSSIDCAFFVTKPPKKDPTFVEIQACLKHFFSHLPNEFKKKTN